MSKLFLRREENLKADDQIARMGPSLENLGFPGH